MTGEADTHIRDVLGAKMTTARPQSARLITHLHRVKHDQFTQNTNSIRKQTMLSISYFKVVVTSFCQVYLETKILNLESEQQPHSKITNAFIILAARSNNLSSDLKDGC